MSWASCMCCAEQPLDRSDVKDADAPATPVFATRHEDACISAFPRLPRPEVTCKAASKADLLAFHSSVRWEKPWLEIREAARGTDLKTISMQKDGGTGNCAVHIAAQNGHTDILRQLIALDVDVNVQNGQGNTGLHMTVAYDLYFTAKLLIDSGANENLLNDAGNKAIQGIDGTRHSDCCWDNPLIMLQAASNAEEMNIAFDTLEAASRDCISKENLIKTGLQKKKSPNTKDFWNHQRFLALAKKF